MKTKTKVYPSQVHILKSILIPSESFWTQVVAGGGAVEAALSVYLENLATTLGSREQLAIAEFAESLLIIPKVPLWGTL